MKRSLLIIGLTLILALGFQSFSLANAGTEEEKNLALVKRLFDEGWNKQKTGVADEIISSHCLFYSSGIQMDKVGPEFLKMAIAQNVKDFPGFRITIEDIFAKDDKVVVRYIFQGTFKKWNKPVILHSVYIAQLSGGKMVKSWVYDNQWQIFKQLGFTLQPPSLQTEENVKKGTKE
jgi:predicted ester cyclase